MFPEFFHICANQHLSQLDEVTMILIVDFDNAPRVCTPSNSATIVCLHNLVRTDYSKRDFALGRCVRIVSLIELRAQHTDRDFFCFKNGFLVLVLVCRCFVDLNFMVRNISQDLGGGGN